MRRLLPLGLAVLMAGTRLSAQSMSTEPPGSELAVYLLTMGQGDEVWERFGHNAIGIRDRSTNSDIVYNWGVFSFEQPGFIGRFLRGEMMYWMAGQDFQTTLGQYQYFNRTVEYQELNLSPAQRVMLRDFIEWNAREENKYYRYDYFLDNCSTRVRDALDRVLGGALRRATDSAATRTTYRWHALRLMAQDPLFSTGIDIGLGRPTDRPITAWEEMFIPMKVRDRIRELSVPDDSGRMVPLVTTERVLFQATRAAEHERPPVRWPWMLALGLILGGALAVPWRRGVTGTRSLATAGMLVVAIGLGVTGCALLYLRLFTRHTAAWDNTNLFVYNPVWIAVALSMAFARSAGGRRVVFVLATFAGIMAMLGLVLPFIPGFDQASYAVVLLAAPAALASGWIGRERGRAAPVVR